jgi:hypothetical protein
MKAERLESELNHPSFLALDRTHLGASTPDVEAHLERCATCRQYLESLAASAPVPNFSLPLPAFERRRARWSQWLGAASLAAAAACGALLWLQHPDRDAKRVDETYVGEKGFRSVWIYVRRGAETQLWDGKRPIAAGDRLRLKIDAGSFHRVEVYSLSDPQHPTRLFESALTPGQTMTVPDAWEVDDSPVAEQLFVVFSNSPLTPTWDDWRRGKVQPGIAVLPFILPKNAASSDAGQLTP